MNVSGVKGIIPHFLGGGICLICEIECVIRCALEVLEGPFVTFGLHLLQVLSVPPAEEGHHPWRSSLFLCHTVPAGLLHGPVGAGRV